MTSQNKMSAWAIPLGLFVGALLLVGLTLKDYGVVWDEPAYFHATELHSHWLAESARHLANGELAKLTDDQKIIANWHWNPYNVPHPPFSRIISALAKELSAPLLDKFSAYRMAPALFFALLTVVSYLWMTELFGRATGLFSVLALIVMPNLFGYAHIAVTDLPLATLWFITAYCFWKGLDNWRWSILVGVVWGLALSTKFPALLIPVPLICWAHLFHRDKYVNSLFAMMTLAPVVMVATQPYLWHRTGLRVLEFVYEGISRGYRPDTNFAVYFGNQIVAASGLPWYYPFFMVGVTTPEPILMLALVACLALWWLREQRAALVLILVNALFVLLLGLMPGAVLHDGVRQLLSALPFLAALAAAGFFVVWQWVTERLHNYFRLPSVNHIEAKLAVVLILLCGLSPCLDLYLTHPFQLSYYNRLVGGIAGAYRRGLETTYFMEAFTPQFVRGLNQQLPKDAVVNASYANCMFEYYRKEGYLRPDIGISAELPFDYYLLLHRRSALSPTDRQLLSQPGRPYLSVSVANVRLVSLFKVKPSAVP